MLKSKQCLKKSTKISNKKSPIIINLFGGPGCGKSTQAAYIFSRLKMLGLNCELVTEFAKDKTWEQNNKALGCQPYIFGKQTYRLDRCVDQVDIVITDSPLFLSFIYNNDNSIEPEFTSLVLKKFNTYNNFNFFIKRCNPYNTKGRSQTENEAKNLDKIIKENLDKYSIPYNIIEGTLQDVEKIIEKVTSHLNN